jgi:hypothetical protein
MLDFNTFHNPNDAREELQSNLGPQGVRSAAESVRTVSHRDLQKMAVMRVQTSAPADTAP